MANDGKVRPFRYTRGKLSVELTFLIIFLSPLFMPVVRLLKDIWDLTTAYRKALKYHPVALGGILTYALAYIASPWAACGLLWGVVGWAFIQPDSYLRHVPPRCQSFLAGFRYRYQMRRKLTANGLLNEHDPIPTISAVTKTGCITRVRVKMSHGDEIDYWRDRAPRLAQTYGALDCKIRPYRRQELLPWRHDMILKPRWLELEFLTRNPFTKPVGVEFIDHYLNPHDLLPLEGNPTSMRRDGTPHGLPMGRQELVVGETGSGKSNYLRARMYANRWAIKTGLLEVWGVDGKKGVELGYMQPLFARYCYGDSANPQDFNGIAVADFLEDAVEVMLQRLWEMRGNGIVLHTPTRDAPALDVLIDEMLVFDSSFIDNPTRKRIWAAIELIQRLGRAPRVRIIGCAQDANMEDLPGRRGFTNRRVYRVKEKIQVDMAAGRGVWDRGGKSDQVPFDQQGTCYEEIDGGTTPEEIRDAMVTDADIQTAISDVGGARVSVLWPISTIHTATDPMWGNQPPPHIEAIPELVATVIEPPSQPTKSGRPSGPSFGGMR